MKPSAVSTPVVIQPSSADAMSAATSPKTPAAIGISWPARMRNLIGRSSVRFGSSGGLSHPADPEHAQPQGGESTADEQEFLGGVVDVRSDHRRREGDPDREADTRPHRLRDEVPQQEVAHEDNNGSAIAIRLLSASFEIQASHSWPKAWFPAQIRSTVPAAASVVAVKVREPFGAIQFESFTASPLTIAASPMVKGMTQSAFVASASSSWSRRSSKPLRKPKKTPPTRIASSSQIAARAKA